MPPPPAPSTSDTPPVARNLPWSGVVSMASDADSASSVLPARRMTVWFFIDGSRLFGHDGALHRRQLRDQLVRHARRHVVALHRDLQVLGQRIELGVADLHVLMDGRLVRHRAPPALVL